MLTSPFDWRSGKYINPGGERCLLVIRAWLPSRLCRLCTMCVNLSILEVVSSPPHCFEVGAWKAGVISDCKTLRAVIAASPLHARPTSRRCRGGGSTSPDPFGITCRSWPSAHLGPTQNSVSQGRRFRDIKTGESFCFHIRQGVIGKGLRQRSKRGRSGALGAKRT